jgi:hypothetical protein
MIDQSNLRNQCGIKRLGYQNKIIVLFYNDKQSLFTHKKIAFTIARYCRQMVY